MSNLWINIRIGNRHLQIGRDGASFSVNPYPGPWFKVYEFFGYSA